VALPAFAAARHAALLTADRAAMDRYLLPTRAHSSKLAAAVKCWDRQTDRQSHRRPTVTKAYAGSADNANQCTYETANTNIYQPNYAISVIFQYDLTPFSCKSLLNCYYKLLQIMKLVNGRRQNYPSQPALELLEKPINVRKTPALVKNYNIRPTQVINCLKNCLVMHHRSSAYK